MSSTHPARSLDFLSRLHDGDLAAAERAHFESHRAHCAECRKAAADFEETLASYRTAGTAPPPADLAARILRRLEASNRRRPLFGVSFGIDLRWAGAFTAALIAVIVGLSVVDRRAESRRIPVFFATPAPAPQAGRPTLLPPLERPRADKPPAAPAAQAVKATSLAPSRTPAPEASAAKEDKDAVAATADRLESPAVAASGRAIEAREKALSSSSVAQNSASPLPGKSVRAPEPAAGPMRVTALDGEGPPPAIRNAAEVALTAEDRGEYLLLVGADGALLEIRRSDSALKKQRAEHAKAPGEGLRRLRFEPGERPRRLLLRVE